MISMIVTILGLFEIYVVMQIQFNSDFTRLVLFPSSFYDDKYINHLLCSFLLYLGLLRLQYVFSGKTLFSWIILILTHIIEAALFWNLAYTSIEFNIKQLSFKEFIIDVLSFNYDMISTVLLLGVPLLVLNFLLFAPARDRKSTKSSENKKK